MSVVRRRNGGSLKSSVRRYRDGRIEDMTVARSAVMAPPPPRPPEPTLIEMGANFAVALAGWIAAGAPVVTEAQYQARLAVCRGCEFWSESARLGMGKCRHKKCGCTRLKLWLSTQGCPLNKWSASK